MGYIGKKAQQNMRDQGFDTSGFQNFNEEKVKDDGKVSIKKTKSQKSPTKSFDDVGDYVDFDKKQVQITDLAHFDFTRADIALFSAGAAVSAVG